MRYSLASNPNCKEQQVCININMETLPVALTDIYLRIRSVRQVKFPEEP